MSKKKALTKTTRSHKVSVRSKIKESEKYFVQHQKGIDQFVKNKCPYPVKKSES